jgi:hypothetical protein
MSSFRRYGGLNNSANNIVTRSYISNSEQMNINNYSGQQNSKETFASHIDLSGNIFRMEARCVVLSEYLVL